MSAHLSEEEQLEALKRWWKDNGKGVVMAVVLGLGATWGWNSYQDYKEEQAQQASLVYLQMLDAESAASPSERTEQQKADITRHAVTLKDEHAGTQYAYYASLMLAKLAVEQSDLDTAATELESVLDSGADEGLKAIANLRLARVQAARGKHQEALALLDSNVSGALAADYAEVRGDIYLQQGDNSAAYTAYKLAMELAVAAGEQSNQLLQLKLNRVESAGSEVASEAAE
ncbi:tetratricopeptide repeat protein [Porticoccaceae bacterium LTM1]|nr:tetratricopeptide repeat protein [Porticoccaceae bacterium LTM1]